MLDFGPGSFFLTGAQLADSPSARHGISSATENYLRLYACEIIQEAGILLRLPQAVAATAQVLFHRFFCKQSFRDFGACSIAASCFWLSMKLEEEEGASGRGRKASQLGDVVFMFQHIRARRQGDELLLPHSPAFKIEKEELLKLEKRILIELGFVCHVEHPHKLLLGYLNCLGASKELIQESWNLVNDSLRTTLCVSLSSNVVACGSIYAAARRLSVPLPASPPWWLLFDVSFEQILMVCEILADLYRQPKSQYIDAQNPPKLNALVDSSPPLEAHDVPPVAHDSNPKSADDVVCKKVVPLISPASASKILNSCFMDASGILPPEDLLVGVNTLPSKTRKRYRDDHDEDESVRRSRPPSFERSCDRSSSKARNFKREDAYGERDSKHRRLEDSRRCSRYYDHRKYGGRHYHSGRVKA